MIFTFGFFLLLLFLFAKNVFWWIFASFCGIYGIVGIFEWIFKINYKLSNFEKEESKKHNFLIIGAGFSGLCIGHFFRLMGLNFKIVEKGKCVGGTWFWNDYPGVGCDVVSHLYSFSFFRNSNWSKSFSLGDEIFRYSQKFWRFAKLAEFTETSATVTSTEWSNLDKKWKVAINYGENRPEVVEKYSWIISCIGAVHKPARPHFSGKFSGIEMHSAEWDYTVDLAGKRVGIVGTGASAIQILPKLVNETNCKSVVLFQRTAPFVFPRYQQVFSENFKSFMAIYPFGVIYRWFQYFIRELLFVFVWKNYKSFFARYMANWFQKMLKNTIQEKTMVQKLTPNFRLGCKRILFADDYYSCMNNEKFTLETDDIQTLTGSGIKTTGSDHDLDVIIYATGFQLMYSNIEMKNLGKTPKDKDDIKSYFGVFLPNVPNYAILLGPMTALGHNSIIFMIECQTQFVLNVIREMFKRGKSSVVVKPETVENFVSEWRHRVDTSVWAPKNCTSWYQQNSKAGRPWTIWPGSTVEYFFRTKKEQPEKFIFE